MRSIRAAWPRPRTAGFAAHVILLGCVLLALTVIVVAHVVGSGIVDPLGQPVSDYVSIPGGYLLVGTSAMAAAVAGLLLAAGLGAAGLPGPGLPVGLLSSWSAALGVLAVFPTNLPGTAADLSAVLHRYASAWVCAALPLVGVLTARRARSAAGWAGSVTRLLRWSWLGVTLSAVFLLAHLALIADVAGPPVLTAVVATLHAVLGGIERLLLVVLLGVLVATAQAGRLAVDHAGADRAGADHASADHASADHVSADHVSADRGGAGQVGVAPTVPARRSMVSAAEPL